MIAIGYFPYFFSFNRFFFHFDEKQIVLSPMLLCPLFARSFVLSLSLSFFDEQVDDDDDVAEQSRQRMKKNLKATEELQ